MESRLKAKVNKYDVIRRSKGNEGCKKHPKHRQSPGVCSICLNEKLSQFIMSDSSSSSKAARSPSSSTSSSSYVSSLSSSDISSCSSPVVSYTCRVDVEAGRKTMRVFNKSRSVAFVSRRRKEEVDQIGGGSGGGGKGGFWSKLLPRKSNGKLMHSRTMVERVITAVH